MKRKSKKKTLRQDIEDLRQELDIVRAHLGFIPHKQVWASVPYDSQVRNTSAMFCIHPNENPIFCPCGAHCYCKSFTCQDQDKERIVQ